MDASSPGEVTLSSAAAATPSPPPPAPATDLAGGERAAPGRGPLGRAVDALRAAASWIFGSIGLLVALSVLAAIPVLQLATLGWLLEAEGRLGRGTPWRTALPGVRKMARIGSALVGCLLLWLPLAILATYAQDARLLAPTSPIAERLATVWLVLACLGLLQGGLAIARGGRVRYFFQPFKNAAWLARRLREGLGLRAAVARVRAFGGGLRLGHYLVLGTQGFVAGFLWLAPPTALLALAHRAPALALLGWPLLALVLPYAVVAQARLAAEGRFGAAFELQALRGRLRRAPLAHLVALVLVLGLALPLYVWKLEPLPRDARWLPAAFFLAALLPGRLAAGWAYARGGRAGQAHLLLRWPCALLTLGAAGVYVFFVFFSQYFAWSGAPGLFAHHALLVPVPFH